MKKILLVDDSVISRSLMKNLLVKNFEVTEAEDGADALQKAQSGKFDIFLLDLNMPDMTGTEIAKELRKDSRYVKSPIFILTSESNDDKKSEGKEAGVTGWIIKDTDQKKFVDSLIQLV